MDIKCAILSKYLSYVFDASAPSDVRVISENTGIVCVKVYDSIAPESLWKELKRRKDVEIYDAEYLIARVTSLEFNHLGHTFRDAITKAVAKMSEEQKSN